MIKKMVISMAFAFFVLSLSCSAQARCCGKFMGKKIVTYGNLSCAKAKSVYKAFDSGHIPAGWTCGQSVGGCGKGKQGFTFKLN